MNDAETKEIMQDFGKIVATLLPGYGFFLMIFEFNSQSRCNYISNAEREDVIRSMKEFIERTEKAWAVDAFEGKFGIGGKPNE